MLEAARPTLSHQTTAEETPRTTGSTKAFLLRCLVAGIPTTSKATSSRTTPVFQLLGQATSAGRRIERHGSWSGRPTMRKTGAARKERSLVRLHQPEQAQLYSDLLHPELAAAEACSQYLDANLTIRHNNKPTSHYRARPSKLLLTSQPTWATAIPAALLSPLRAHDPQAPIAILVPVATEQALRSRGPVAQVTTLAPKLRALPSDAPNRTRRRTRQ